MNKSSSSGSGWLRPILLAVLVVLVVALVWDLFASSQAKKAYAELERRLDEQVGAAGEEGMNTFEDVRQLIGFSPEQEKNPAYTLETYRWRRGLPWQSYFISVVYTPRGHLFAASLNEPPDEFSLPDAKLAPPPHDPSEPTGDPSVDKPPTERSGAETVESLSGDSNARERGATPSASNVEFNQAEPDRAEPTDHNSQPM